MRRAMSFLIAGGLLALACSPADTPTAVRTDGGDGDLAPAARSAAATPRTFVAHLNARQEVGVDVDSRAQGQAVLKLSKGGSSIAFRVNIANIDDVLMAHLHLAPAGQNGPIVVWLRPDGPPPQLIPGRFSGPYAVGTITAADFVGPLAGASFDALVSAIRSGQVYVNVHTVEYPGGEIRGQLR